MTASEAERKLERITGLWVVAEKEGDHWNIKGWINGDRRTGTVASSCRDDLSEAVDLFLQHNLSRIRLDLLHKQNGRCAVCQRAVPLQLHHKVFRSEHRDDREENLHLLCNSCHQGQHGRSARLGPEKS